MSLHGSVSTSKASRTSAAGSPPPSLLGPAIAPRSAASSAAPRSVAGSAAPRSIAGSVPPRSTVASPLRSLVLDEIPTIPESPPPPAYTSSSASRAASPNGERDKKKRISGSQHGSTASGGTFGRRSYVYQSMTPTPPLPESGRSNASAASVIGEEDQYGALTPSGETPSMMDVARQQVVSTLAFRAASAMRTVGDLKIGVYSRSSECTPEDQHVSLDIARAVAGAHRLKFFLFALLSVSAYADGAADIVLCASSQALLEKGAALVQVKFLGRVARASLGECIWLGILENPPFVPAGDSAATNDLDEEALWHILRRVAQDDAALDPLVPPPGSKSIDDILASARARFTRIKPRDAFDECVIFNNLQGAVLVDIRPAAQRHHYGEIPGALIIERNVLEWRFDPRSDARLDIATRYDLRVIVFCQEGYTSSLAAASLHDLGLKNATDIVGGFKEWKEAGLPTTGGQPHEIAALVG